MKKKNNIILFSILMPLYNNSKYLEGSIKSVLNQTIKNFELIIIDDKSTDNSLDIAKKFSLKCNDKRIKIFKNKRNIGAYKTLNAALKISIGKYISKLDPDDKFHINRLEEDLKYLIKHKFVISKYIREPESNMYYYNNLDSEIKDSYSCQHSMITFERKTIMNFGPWLNCRFGGDTELFNRIKLIYGKDAIYSNNKTLYVAIKKNDKDQLTSKYNISKRKIFVKYYKLLHKNYNKKINNKDYMLLKSLINEISISPNDNRFNLDLLKIKI